MGSDKDMVLRQYLERDLLKESLFNKLTLLSNIGLTSETRSSFNKDYSRYIDLLFMQDDRLDKEEEALRARYEKIRKTKPKLEKGANGTLSVSGLSKG